MDTGAERYARTETSEIYKFIDESEQQNDKLNSEQCGLEVILELNVQDYIC